MTATRFAPAERATPADLQRQIGYFAGVSLTGRLLDSIPTIQVILNRQRQIVYANRALQEITGVADRQLLYGLRPGEALDCIHAHRSEGGCATGEACSTCGGALAILAGLSGENAQRECRITRCCQGRTEAMDLQVRATPLHHHADCFTVFTVSDISHEKRRRSLESIFFHDMLNMVGSIRGFAELLRDYDLPDRAEVCGLIHAAAERVVDEIVAQRTLAAAESRELQVRPEAVSVVPFLRQLVEIYRRHEVAEGRELLLSQGLPEIIIVSDRVLLGRVLGNMIKNALEACRPAEKVTVSCRVGEGRVAFSVHNPAFIDPRAQLQVFQRSFSTKGPGRGLGTYGMRLLSEYLQGEVTFHSDPDEGTTFLASYPVTLS